MNTPPMTNFCLASMAALAASVGCAMSKPKAPPAMPVSANELTTLREAFTRVDPNARLASVTESLPGGGYVRLGDAPPADFPAGTAVAFIDASRQTIAHGEVVKSDAGGIDVRVEADGTRSPAVGDVAVRFE